MTKDHGPRPQEAVPTESPVVAGSMLEKAAKGMWDARDARIAPKYRLPWEEASEEARDITRKNVVAALQAIRRPDAYSCGEAQAKTGIAKSLASRSFTVIIDAILSEGKA